MPIEQIQAFSFTSTPMFPEDIPIRSIEVIIYVKDRKEAELIHLRYAHQFFDHSCTVIVKEGPVGFRQVK